MPLNVTRNFASAAHRYLVYDTATTAVDFSGLAVIAWTERANGAELGYLAYKPLNEAKVPCPSAALIGHVTTRSGQVTIAALAFLPDLYEIFKRRLIVRTKTVKGIAVSFKTKE